MKHNSFKAISFILGMVMMGMSMMMIRMMKPAKMA
jgi:hypothetical protein